MEPQPSQNHQEVIPLQNREEEPAQLPAPSGTEESEINGITPDKKESKTVKILCYGDTPLDITCPKCSKSVKTKIKRKAVYQRNLKSLLMFIFFRVFLPFCNHPNSVPWHYCPNCGVYLGKPIESSEGDVNEEPVRDVEL